MNLSSIYGENEQKRASLISLTPVVFFATSRFTLVFTGPKNCVNIPFKFSMVGKQIALVEKTAL